MLKGCFSFVSLILYKGTGWVNGSYTVVYPARPWISTSTIDVYFQPSPVGAVEVSDAVEVSYAAKIIV